MKLLAVIVLAALGGAAHADRVPARARALADRGRAAHDQHDYPAAIAAFTEAYALAPAPALLFNLAQAYRLAGRCDDATLMYRRFLASAPPDDARQLAETHLASVERCAQDRQLRVVADASTIKLRLPSPPEPVTIVDAPPRVHTKLGGGLAVAGGVALLVAGSYALQAHQTGAEVERRYEHGEKWRTLAPLDAKGQRAQAIAEVAGVGGLVLAAAAATVLVIDHRRHGKRRIDVAPPPAGHGARVSLSWQF